MQLGLSSLAWSPVEDRYVAEQASDHGLEFVDLTLSKYFGAGWSPSAAQLDRLRNFWSTYGLPVRALQSLLFGTQGLSVFGDSASRSALVEHLGRVAALGAALGAITLVFGSPRNRDRGALDNLTAEAMAVDVFRRAGDAVAAHGLTLCLEPNPTRYGCNFMTDVATTVRIVHAVSHPAVGLNFDVGSVHANGESPAAALRIAQGTIIHVHLSEPDLLPPGETDTDHVTMARALHGAGVKAASIEVLPAAGRHLQQWLPACLTFVARTYRNPHT